jgi:hypothetical protein
VRDVFTDGRTNGWTHCCADEIADVRADTDTYRIADSESVGGANCYSFGNTNGGSVCNAHRDPDRLSDVVPHTCAYRIADNESVGGADCCSFGNTNGGSVCNAHRDPAVRTDCISRCGACVIPHRVPNPQPDAAVPDRSTDPVSDLASGIHRDGLCVRSLLAAIACT